MTKCASRGCQIIPHQRLDLFHKQLQHQHLFEVESGDGETDDMSEDIDEVKLNIIQEEDVLHADEEEIAFLDF